MKKITIFTMLAIMAICSKAFAVIGPCELRVEVGDENDLCIVMNEDNLIEYASLYTSNCSLSTIIEEISGSEHYCRFVNEGKNTRVIGFQTKGWPTHDKATKDIEGSTITNVKETININLANDETYLFSGAAFLWNSEGDNCLGDPTNDGKCGGGSTGNSNDDNNYWTSGLVKWWDVDFLSGATGEAEQVFRRDNWDGFTKKTDELCALGLCSTFSAHFEKKVTVLDPIGVPVNSDVPFPEFAKPVESYYRAKINIDVGHGKPAFKIKGPADSMVIFRDIEFIVKSGYIMEVDGPIVYIARSVARNENVDAKREKQLILLKSGWVNFNNNWKTKGWNTPFYIFNSPEATSPEVYLRIESNLIGFLPKNEGEGLWGGLGWEYRPEINPFVNESFGSIPCVRKSKYQCSLKPGYTDEDYLKNLYVTVPGNEDWFNDKLYYGQMALESLGGDGEKFYNSIPSQAIIYPVLCNAPSYCVPENGFGSWKLDLQNPKCKKGKEVEMPTEDGGFYCEKKKPGANYDDEKDEFACPDGSDWNDKNTKCVKKCPDGAEVVADKTCKENCGEGKGWNSKYSECVINCPADSEYGKDLSRAPGKADSGCFCNDSSAILQDNQCVSCPVGTTRVAHDQCSKCPDGQFLDPSANTCKEYKNCDQATTTLISSTNTCECKWEGAAFTDESQTVCACPAGTVKDTSGFKTSCVSGTEPPPECSSDSECSDDELCKDGECVDKDEPPLGGDCKTNSDCGIGMVCSSDEKCDCDTANHWKYESNTGKCEYEEDDAVDTICTINGGTYVASEGYCEFVKNIAICKNAGKIWDEAEGTCSTGGGALAKKGGDCTLVPGATSAGSMGTVFAYLTMLGSILILRLRKKGCKTLGVRLR